MKVLLFVTLFIAVSFATEGFDLSYYQGSVTQSAYDCLAGYYSFGIIEATAGAGGYNSYGLLSSIFIVTRNK